MPRTSKGPPSRARKKSLFKKAKGYTRGRNRRYKVAHETVMRALRYAKRDRRVRKREMRSLWNNRISAICQGHDLSYSRLIDGLKKAEISLNRKILAYLAVADQDTFAALAKLAKENGARANH